MITKVTYDLPAIPANTTYEDAKAFIDVLAAFFAEKLGIVVRTDMALEKPDWAPNSYVVFLAKDNQIDYPWLCIYNSNTDNAAGLTTFWIQTCTYLDGVGYKPANTVGTWVPTGSTTLDLTYGANSHAMNYCISKNHGSQVVTITTVNFADGRKFAYLRILDKTTRDLVEGTYNIQCIFITPIVFLDGTSTTTLCFGVNCDRFYTSYLPYIQSEAGNTLTLLQKSNAENLLGFKPPISTTEALISIDYWIDNKICIPNVFEFSNTQNKKVGTVLTIDNKSYIGICPYVNNSQYWQLCIPEEV
ncbi:MAG: hypothetical protein IKN54_06080 [Lachnospiraceae bacterium]|nr:hypothetical protein [Lachnospiraceae bacterium]